MNETMYDCFREDEVLEKAFLDIDLWAYGLKCEPLLVVCGIYYDSYADVDNGFNTFYKITSIKINTIFEKDNEISEGVYVEKNWDTDFSDREKNLILKFIEEDFNGDFNR